MNVCPNIKCDFTIATTCFWNYCPRCGKRLVASMPKEKHDKVMKRIKEEQNEESKQG